MSNELLDNTGVHESLTPILAEAAEEADTTDPGLHSVATWWFCHRLTPEQRAKILLEYLKCHRMKKREVLAMR